MINARRSQSPQRDRATADDSPNRGDWAVSAAVALVLRSVRQTTDSSSRRETQGQSEAAMNGAACRDPHDEDGKLPPVFPDTPWLRVVPNR
jgi:hypothetical protein